MGLNMVGILQALGLLAASPRTVERFVSHDGSDSDDGETSATPYKTIAKAIETAAGLGAGNHLLITLSGGPFIEAVELPSNATLKGVAGERPEIGSPGGKPTLAIFGKSHVYIENVKIRDGKRAAHEGDANGGGIVIYYAMDVKVENCEIFANEGYSGGGVSIYHAEDVKVAKCEIVGNNGYRGGGVSVVNSNKVAVLECTITFNSAGTRETAIGGADFSETSRKIVYPVGAGHGGGVYIADSEHVEVARCQISENHAILFGGGIAIVNNNMPHGRIDIRDNEIFCNQVAHADIRGLIDPADSPLACDRPAMTDVVFQQLQAELITDAKVNQLVDVLHGLGLESGLGGGVALARVTADTVIADNRIGLSRTKNNVGNVARRGGGIACYTGAYPQIIGNEIAFNRASDDGGGISIDQFDPFVLTEAYGIKPQTMLPRHWITLEDNNVHDNRAASDGGGLYATGAALVSIKGPKGLARFANNRANENGGGIRVSYAVNLYASDVKIHDNEAFRVWNAERLSGGGGVAARNSMVTLERCNLTGNKVNSFAGGGVYFVSCFEGGYGTKWGIPTIIGNKRGQFDELMERSFGFHTRVLRLIDCTGGGNMASGERGAGGFLYAVRDPSMDNDTKEIKGGVEPMWIIIEGAATRFGTNQSDYQRNEARKRATVTIELSGRQRGTVTEDRVFIADNVPAAGIPSCIAADSQPTGRSVTVLLNNDPAHDVFPTLALGNGFTLGPVPTLTTVAPSLSATAGGTILKVNGSNFEEGMRVLVGGKEAKQKGTPTSTSITVETPTLPAGVVDIAIQSASGPRAVKTGCVRVIADPSIITVEPQTGPPGTEVTIIGASFVGTPAVKVRTGIVATTAVVVAHPTETELRVKMPPASIGIRQSVGLEITLESGQSCTREDIFVYSQ